MATVLAIVLSYNVIAESEWVQGALPFLRVGQLKLHRWLCGLTPRATTPKWVRIIEIDDAAHLKLGEPTDRAVLARLISAAVAGDATVIVLDLKLLAPLGMNDGSDDESRASANRQLIQAVNAAAAKGVPVILTTWLQRNEAGTFVERPNSYAKTALPLADASGRCTLSLPSSNRQPSCARLGNINLPIDRRRVPLEVKTADGGRSVSLALATVSAYEDVVDRQPRTRAKRAVSAAIASGELPFASFIPESSFQRIPFPDLSSRSDEALPHCRDAIVMIGGTWHADLGRGDQVDSYETPVGRMRGLYLHANYVEALLDDRYHAGVPLSVALLFDAAAGTLLYVGFHRATTVKRRLTLLLIPAGLLAGSYVVLANLGHYLDFVLPLGACIVHLVVECARDYQHLRTSRPEAVALRS